MTFFGKIDIFAVKIGKLDIYGWLILFSGRRKYLLFFGRAPLLASADQLAIKLAIGEKAAVFLLSIRAEKKVQKHYKKFKVRIF